MTPGGINCKHDSENGLYNLLSKSIKSLALAFQSVDNVQSGDRLSASMLGVGDGITDDVFEECLEDSTGFLVHHTRDALDTTTTCKTTDSWLGDALDVIPTNLAMSFSTALSESLSFSRHCVDSH